MVLSLQKVEFLLDAIAGLADGKFERLPRLRRALQHKNTIKCINKAAKALNTPVKVCNTPGPASPRDLFEVDLVAGG